MFLPWLFERVAADKNRLSDMGDIVDTLLVSVGETAEAARINRVETRHREKIDREQAIRQARQRQIHVFIPGDLIGQEEGERLGPVLIQAGEAIKGAENKVVQWLQKQTELEEIPVPEGGFFAGYLQEARRQGGGWVGNKSTLLEVQEQVGISDEIVLKISFES